jgi:hypothetical protein
MRLVVGTVDLVRPEDFLLSGPKTPTHGPAGRRVTPRRRVSHRGWFGDDPSKTKPTTTPRQVTHGQQGPGHPVLSGAGAIRRAEHAPAAGQRALSRMPGMSGWQVACSVHTSRDSTHPAPSTVC